MGIQINGQTDRISAVDGSFSIQDLAEVNVTGVATASNFKTGTSNVHSTGYECANINATGIVTAASANFTGNVSIGGTLTYQDVTNIDSVGVITARDGLHVSGGNVLVGTTDATIYNNGDSDSEGIVLRNGEVIDIARKGDLQLTLNRQTNDGPHIGFFRSGSPKTYISTRNDAFCIDTGGLNERLRISSSGSVGIGTDSMTSALQIYAADTGEGTAKGQITLKDTAAYNQTPTGGVVFQGHHTTGAQAIFAGIRGFKANTGNGDYDGCLAFDVRKHGAVAYEAMRINEDGNVGIGTDAPADILHLRNNAPVITTEATNASSGLRFNILGQTSATSQIFRVQNDNSTLFTILKSGNVGINETNPIADLSITGANGSTMEIQPDIVSGTNRITNYNRSTSTYKVFRLDASQHEFLISGTEKVRITSGGDVGINETSPDTNLHISRSANQNDTHGILKVESTSTGTGAATNASIITKNRYGWSQFMQWEENGLRIGSRSTSTGGTGTVTVTYGSDNTGAVINQNGVVTMPQQCGFHVVLHTSQTLTNNGMVNLWDTDASDSRSYIKNMTFNAGRFVAPVSGLYYFTAQLLLSGVASNDDNIHIAWTTGSGNDTFAYWNTRHDGASANGSYGYGGYLPVCGSTTVYLAANAIFGIRANFTGGIGIHGTDANWGHWSGFLVG